MDPTTPTEELVVPPDLPGYLRSASDSEAIWMSRRRASSLSAPAEVMRALSDIPGITIDFEDMGVGDKQVATDGDTKDDNESDDVFAPESPNSLRTRMRSRSLLCIQDQVTYALTRQLKEMHKKLHLKETERAYLNEVPQKLTDEIRELDITLEKEANTLIQEANEQREYAEKMLREANYKMDVLQAEVSFLKSLVLTSTPSKPNKHLHPHLETKKRKPPLIRQPRFVATLRRSLSTHSLSKQPSSPTVEEPPTTPPAGPPATPRPILQRPVSMIETRRDSEEEEPEDTREVDPVYLSEFKAWRLSQPTSVDITCTFMNHIIKEEVNPCLNFQNTQLASEVFHAALDNQIAIEPVCETSPKPCALTGTTHGCHYIIRLGENGPTHTISRNARNRIASVCNFFMYLRYITQGLVKRDDNVMYWEVMELRKEMVLARLALLA